MNRTWFFVPGSKEKFLEKSKSLNADILIFDLEDSVVKDDKASVRKRVIEFISNNEFSQRKYIRVNDIYSLYFLEDVKELAGTDIEGIVVPKINSDDDVKIVDYILNYYERINNSPGLKIIPLIESGLGIENAYKIAKASARIECLAFGAEDYKLDANISSAESHTFTYLRSVLINASSAANIGNPIDSIFPDFNDDTGLEQSSLNSSQSGFRGRLVIHPNQLGIVNACYGASSEELEEAREIVEAYDEAVNEGSGALKVNGKMIDGPVAERARKLLKMSKESGGI